MMKTGILIALVVVAFLIIGGAVFHEELSDFVQSMRPDRMEAAIRFGKALDPSGRSVLDPTTIFTLGENVAWVVQFEKSAGVKELVVALFEVTQDGREVPLDRNKMTVEPTDIGLYNFTTTQAFWSLSKKQTNTDRRIYRIKYLKKRVIAQGEFTIIGAQGDQSSQSQPNKAP